MFLIKKPTNGILVEVTETRWDAFGDTSSRLSEYRSFWLLIILKRIGGINESVAPGLYDFNVTWKPPFKFIASLEPLE